MLFVPPSKICRSHRPSTMSSTITGHACARCWPSREVGCDRRHPSPPSPALDPVDTTTRVLRTQQWIERDGVRWEIIPVHLFAPRTPVECA